MSSAESSRPSPKLWTARQLVLAAVAVPVVVVAGVLSALFAPVEVTVAVVAALLLVTAAC
ncbi:MAG: hypothetical protein QOC98_1609, partial [Frankiaceae bacterium]|nr:hypothetical protein [Frankiaceae bacterium]